MVQWRKRKRGTPRQVGMPFPLDKESQQQKKGLLDKIRGRLGSDHKSPEQNYLEKLRDIIAEHTEPTEAKLADGILTEAEAEYLEKKGLIKIDSLTEDISLTPEGQAVFLKEKIKQRDKELRTLTQFERDLIMKKRETEDIEGEDRR